MARSDATRDALLEGKLTLLQPRTGYRVNVDSILLAAFAAEGRGARLLLDLGSGVGALALILGRVGFVKKSVLIEREPELVVLARENLSDNGLAGTVVERDLERSGLPPSLAQQADLVVCNPPFYPAASGTPAESATRARSGELLPFVRAARRALSGPRTRAAFCYPAAALAELFACARDERLVPKRLRLVHPRADAPARLALVELRLAKPGGLVLEPPLVEWQSARVRTPELARLVAGRFGSET
jgi:tRNA1Val (adenine37-N6)-methyltransferase